MTTTRQPTTLTADGWTVKVVELDGVPQYQIKDPHGLDPYGQGSKIRLLDPTSVKLALRRHDIDWADLEVAA